MTCELVVEEPVRADGSILVMNVRGRLVVGDVLTSAVAPSGEAIELSCAVDVIQLYGQTFVSVLDEVFIGRLFPSQPVPAEITRDWRILSS